MILLTETSGTGKETEQLRGFEGVAWGRNGQGGLLVQGLLWGRGYSAAMCSGGWHIIVNILNMHDVFNCKLVILFKTNNKQYTEHEKIK